MRLFSFTLISALLVSASSFGQSPTDYGMETNDLPQGLMVGDEVTSSALTAVGGEELNLVNDGYTVVFFYRGSWCPYCTRHLSALSDSLSFILERANRVIAFTPQVEEEELDMAMELAGMDLDIVVDESGEWMKYFDVDFVVTQAYQEKIINNLHTDLGETNGQEEVVLPVPAAYIIDSEGRVIWRYFDINYRKRPSPSLIFENLPSAS